MCGTDMDERILITDRIKLRQKWYFRNDNLRVGDVVGVIGPGKIGRIEQTYPGPDDALCEWWTYGLMARPLRCKRSVIRLMCNKDTSKNYKL